MNDALPFVNPWVRLLARYEPGRPIEEVAREFGFAPASAVKLASNENALGPSPRAIEAMRRYATHMHIYPDGAAWDLVGRLAERLAVDRRNLIVTNGSNEAIELLSHVYLGPDRSIVMGACAFVVYRLCASLFRAETVAVPMPEHVHDLDAMAAAVRPDTRLLFVANPNNPTGTMVDGAAIDRLLERLPPHVLVVLDEAYVDLLPPERQPDVLRHVREGRRVAILRTFSKTYGLAGLRIGFVVAPAEVVDCLQRVRQPFNVNAMALEAACAALDDAAHLDRTRALVAEGLAFYEAACRRLGLAYIPSVANFLCVHVGRGREVFHALEREGVIVRPMDVYGLPGHVRITVGLPAENVRCVAALERVLCK